MLDVPKALYLAVSQLDFIRAPARWNALSGGRTNRVWQIDTVDGPLVCKLFSQSSDNPLYPNLPGAEYEALKALHRHKISPEPVALLNTDVGEALIYRHLNGVVWQSDPTEVARLLARLHQQTPDLPLRQIASGSSALIDQTFRILAQCTQADHSLKTAPENPHISAIQTPILIHTDVVPGNLIVTPDGLRLIDWQCPGMGDPCEDLASFLSPAMQVLYGRPPLSTNGIEQFLTAYNDPQTVARYRKLAPLFHWRAAAYCQWKVEQGDQDYLAALQLERSALQKTRRDDD